MWLSTVAIVALVIVAIIAALILIILLTPITYSIEVDGRSPYRGEVRVKWLWRVFSLHLAYLQDKPFFKELYILGMLKIGPVKDYEEWLENRVDEEYQKLWTKTMICHKQRPLLRRCKGADKVLLQALVVLALKI